MPGLIRGMDTRASDGSVGLDRSSSTAQWLSIVGRTHRNTLGDYSFLNHQVVRIVRAQDE